MTPTPFVTVIMPARNEGRHIGRALRSLLRTEYPACRWEIVVADGMSTDGTREAIARVAAKSPVPIRIVDNPRRITPCALNAAIRAARGSIIIRVDAHAHYRRDYIARCVRVLRETHADNVGGPVDTRPGARTPMARAIALVMSHRLGVGNSAFRTSEAACEVDTVPFGCFPADVFHRVGLFDERLVRHQDYDMNRRIRRAGGRIWLDTRIKSTYISRPDYRALLKYAWVNGYWNALTHRLHPYTLSVRHAIPPVFALGVLVALAGIPARALFGLPLPLYALVLAGWAGAGAYALLVSAVSLGLARRYGLALLPPLLAAFPGFHLVYGLATAWGWLCAALGRFPWRESDGIPEWTTRASVGD